MYKLALALTSLPLLAAVSFAAYAQSNLLTLPELPGSRSEVDRGSVPYSYNAPLFTAATITGATWASTSGGQATFAVSSNLTSVIAGGSVVYVSGVTSTGGTGFGSGGTSGAGYNGDFGVVSVSSTQVVVTMLLPSTPGTYSSGGTLGPGGTHAASIIQNVDSQAFGYNHSSATAINATSWTGNGLVSGVATGGHNGTSYSFEQGYQFQGSKSGDGSFNIVQANGALGASGPAHYNELGAFQGALTNTGSTNGYMSFVEGLLDDGGFTTRMNGVLSGLKVNGTPTTNFPTYNYGGYNAGGQAAKAFVGITSNGPYETLIDFTAETPANVSSGDITKFYNGGNLAWLESGGALRPILSLNSSNVTALFAASGGGGLFTATFAQELGFGLGGVTVGTPSGGAKGAGTLNAVGGIYLNGKLELTPGFVALPTTTFAALGTADPIPAAGHELVISDASTCAANAIVSAGGGSAHSCAVVFNGASWIALVTH